MCVCMRVYVKNILPLIPTSIPMLENPLRSSLYHLPQTDATKLKTRVPVVASAKEHKFPGADKPRQQRKKNRKRSLREDGWLNACGVRQRDVGRYAMT